jgi:Recombinase
MPKDLYWNCTSDVTRKAAVLTRIRRLKAQGLTLQAIAERLTAEGVPTLSGTGRWQRGTIGNLLAGR